MKYSNKIVYKSIFCICLLIFTFTVIGTSLVNTHNVPTLLILSIILLSLLPILFAILNINSEKVLFFAIVFISATFSIIAPLRGRIIGGDAPLEIHVIRTISDTGVWDLTYGIPVGPLLHNPFIVIIEKLLSVDPIHVFNIYSSFLTVPIVLATYIFLRNYITRHFAFLLSIFIAFQYSMVRSGLGGIRATTSVLFFVLFLYSLGTESKPLQIVTLVSVFISYYSTGVFLIMFFTFVFIIDRAARIVNPNEYSVESVVGTTIVVLSGVFGISWLIYLGLFSHVVVHLEMIFSIDALFPSGGSGDSSSGGGTSITLPDLFIYMVLGLTFSSMSLGVLVFILKGRSNWRTLHSLVLSSLIISGIVVGTPLFSETRISMTSIYRQTVFLLILGIPVGIVWIVRNIPKRVLPSPPNNIGIILVAIIVALQLPAFTGLAYHVHGSGPGMIWFDEEGEQSEIWKVEDEELVQTDFLLKYGSKEMKIHGDRYSEHRTLPFITREWQRPNIAYFVDENYRSDPGYVYLRSQNVNEGMIAPRGTAYTDMEPIEKHPYLFKKEKIYSSGYGETRLHEG